MSDRSQYPTSEVLNPLSDAKIVDSWQKNAAPWTTAIRDEQIESRKLVTNSAIIDVVTSLSPKTAVDIGCGEGWLSNRLAEKGVDVLGTDVVPELVAQAQVTGKARFQVLSYEEIAQGKLQEKFDLAVCNFALLGNESVRGLFRAVPALLEKGGTFVVQTIHPVIGCGDLPYADGWRQGSWAGFSSDFTDPAPWYFRTIESWVKLFNDNGITIREIREPINPKTQKAASIIFIGEVSGK